MLGKWLRGLDLNQRPPGYEPDELPGCSTPQKHHNTQLRFFCKRPFPGLSLSLPDGRIQLLRPAGLIFHGLALFCAFPGARLVPKIGQRACLVSRGIEYPSMVRFQADCLA
jgi:hypothetical protein